MGCGASGLAAAPPAEPRSPDQQQALRVRVQPPRGPHGSPGGADTQHATPRPRSPDTATSAAAQRATGALPSTPGTPLATRSQLARSCQLPQLPLEEWDDEHVRAWLLSLPHALHRYVDELVSPGGLVTQWSEQLLAEAGVANAFHRKQLLEYRKQLYSDIQALARQQRSTPSRKGTDPGGVDCVPTPDRPGFLPGSIRSPRGGGEVEEATFSIHRRKARRTGSGSGSGEEGDATGGIGLTAGDVSTPTRVAGELRRNGSGQDGPGAEGGRDDFDDEGEEPRSKVSKVLAEYDDGKLVGGIGVLRDVVRVAGSMAPWPGDAAAALVIALLDLGESVLINRRNLQQLNTRAVDLLQLIASNKALHADTHSYRALMHRLINTLKAIKEYFVDYTNRNWLMRMVNTGRDTQMFLKLWNALGGLVADASFGLQVEAASVQQQAGRVLDRIHKRQLRYDDEEARLRQRIEEGGGVEAVVRDPQKLLQLTVGLNAGSQLTLHKVQEAVALLEANSSEGVHSLIPHPDLRVLWRKCFSPRQDVTWALWWAAFPTELARVPVEAQVISRLAARLEDERRRVAFERHMEGAAAGRVSVVELRRHVPADADLLAWVAQLTVRPSLDGVADSRSSAGSVVASTAPTSPSGAGGASASASGGASGAVAAARALRAWPSSEPRCRLPPLDADRFVGRENDVRQVVELLYGGLYGRPGGSHRPSASGSASEPSVAQSLDAQGAHSLPPAPAVCIVGESGQGKSALAVAAARRVWDMGRAQGGAYHVDLRGADCRAELAARMAAALGAPQCERDGAAAAVAAALQSLAARGTVLLVLDGADCLDEVERIPGADEDATAEGEAQAPDGDAAAAPRRLVGGGAGLSATMRERNVHSALCELLAAAPTARLLLTSTQPISLRGREVELFWLGALPEPAAVALVQDMAQCLSTDEARQLVSACGQSPLVLRMAASAVATGALTLADTITRARTAVAVSAALSVPRASIATPPIVSPRGPPTPRLQRSLSPIPPMRTRFVSYPSLALPPSQMPAADARREADQEDSESTPLHPSGGGGAGGAAAALAAALSAAAPGEGRGSNSGADNGSGYDSLGPSTASTAITVTTATTAAAAAGAGSQGSGGGSASRGAAHYRTYSVAKSMSFLLATSEGSGAATNNHSLVSGRGMGSMGRTYGAGAAVAAALLGGLSTEHSRALVALSIMPGSWDEDAAAALLGQPPYAVRALLDVLLGYSVITWRGCSVQSSGGGFGGGFGGFGVQGSYSLTPGVVDAARAKLADLDVEGKVSLQCRFVGHVLSVFLRADRLYGTGAVRAAMALVSELRQDVQAMLLVAATCPDRERMLGGAVGAAALPALAASPLFAALVLDASTELESFWTAVAEYAAAKHDAALSALAARALAQLLHRAARYREAEKAWRDALLQAARVHGPASLASAACHCGLGTTLSAMGRHREAEAQHADALRLRRAALGERHAEVAASLSDVARVMRNTGRFKEAEAAYEEALRVRIALLGEDHPDVADSLNSCGIVAGLCKRHEQEEQLYRRALAIRQRALGHDHPDVAQSLNNIGTALSSQGKHAAAELVFREALTIKRRVLGPNHHAVGTSLNNIARALRYQNKLPEAEAACQEAIHVLEAALGATHPAVTTAVANLIFLLRRQGKDDAAATVYSTYRPRWTSDLGQLGDEAMAVLGAAQARGLQEAAASAAGYSRPPLAPAHPHEPDSQHVGAKPPRTAGAPAAAPRHVQPQLASGAAAQAQAQAQPRMQPPVSRLTAATGRGAPIGVPGEGGSGGGLPPRAPPRILTRPSTGDASPARAAPDMPLTAYKASGGSPTAARQGVAGGSPRAGATQSPPRAAPAAAAAAAAAVPAVGGAAAGEVISRPDASELLRKAMAEAARLAHADLQSMEAEAKRARRPRTTGGPGSGNGGTKGARAVSAAGGAPAPARQKGGAGRPLSALADSGGSGRSS